MLHHVEAVKIDLREVVEATYVNSECSYTLPQQEYAACRTDVPYRFPAVPYVLCSLVERAFNPSEWVFASLAIAIKGSVGEFKKGRLGGKMYSRAYPALDDAEAAVACRWRMCVERWMVVFK